MFCPRRFPVTVLMVELGTCSYRLFMGTRRAPQPWHKPTVALWTWLREVCSWFNPLPHRTYHWLCQ